MVEALRGGARRGRQRERSVAALACAALLLACGSAPPLAAQDRALRLREGRFTVLATDSGNTALARALLAHALRTDTFPGLPRPRSAATIAIARDARQFREWIGPTAPEWGSAVAFPAEQRVVMQGRRAGARAGDPLEVLRHELAHLALHEALGDLPPRWFDEGYASFAAGEWSREDALRANVALAMRGAPTLDELERWFSGGTPRAEAGYALAYRAVAEMAELDRRRGLTLFFAEWGRTRKLDTALRNAYGVTLAGFEARWRDRTRRRYGGLAVLADVTIAGLFLLAILTPLYMARRRRDRRRMLELRAADEAAERTQRESALEVLLGSDRPGGGPARSSNGAAPAAGETP